jgi:hypothetical protein
MTLVLGAVQTQGVGRNSVYMYVRVLRVCSLPGVNPRRLRGVISTILIELKT